MTALPSFRLARALAYAVALLNAALLFAHGHVYTATSGLVASISLLLMLVVFILCACSTGKGLLRWVPFGLAVVCFCVHIRISQ